MNPGCISTLPGKFPSKIDICLRDPEFNSHPRKCNERIAGCLVGTFKKDPGINCVPVIKGKKRGIFREFHHKPDGTKRGEGARGWTNNKFRSNACDLSARVGIAVGGVGLEGVDEKVSVKR